MPESCNISQYQKKPILSYYRENSTSLNNDNYSGHFFCRFTVHRAHTTGSKPPIPENSSISQNEKKIETDYRENCNFFKKGQVFSNKLFLTNLFKVHIPHNS